MKLHGSYLTQLNFLPNTVVITQGIYWRHIIGAMTDLRFCDVK